MKKPSNEYIIHYISQCKQEAEDASRLRRQAMKELWDVYQSKQDYSKKEKWQSQTFIPKTFMVIEKAASLITRALMRIDKLFTVKPTDASIKELEGEALDRVIAKADEVDKKLKTHLEESNFIACYSEMITSGFLLGFGAPKLRWEGDRNGTTEYDNVDILNLFIDPNYMPYQKGNPKYIIEFQEMDLASLRTNTQRTNNQAGKAIFNMKVIKKIEADYAEPEEKSEELRRRGLGDYSPVSKKVGLEEFWGDIISEDGKEVLENQLIVIANGKHIIRWQDNPFEHGKHPYILTTPIVYPHRGIAGISLIEPIVKVNYLYNNIVNMSVDKLNWSVNPMFELKRGRLLNPKTLTDLYPGKQIWSDGTGRAVEEIQVAGIKADTFVMLELLAREIQEGTAITEFIMGMPGKKSKTLGEVEIKTQESQGFFDVIARRLEQHSIKPLLIMTLDLLRQFTDDDLEGEFKFNVGGLSLLLIQKEQVTRLMQILGMALKAPDLAPITDIPELWQKLLSIYNLSDVYKEPEETEEMAEGQPEQQAQIQQKAAQDAKRLVSQISPEQLMRMG